MCRAGASSVHAVVMRNRLQQLRRVVLLHAVRDRMARSLIWPSAPRGRMGHLFAPWPVSPQNAAHRSSH